MCGIVGYTGPLSAQDVLISGLSRLEYRGYDSAGISVISEGELVTRKKAGRLSNLVNNLAEEPIATAHTGIGHTRWATHGGPTDTNAHPHHDNADTVSVIHNGIIENFAGLRAELLEQGVVFNSETDSEAVAHMLAVELRNGCESLTCAMRRVAPRLHGTFTLLAIDPSDPDVIVGARKNSPLVAGRSEHGMFLASDVAAFVEHTTDAIELGQEQIVTITPTTITVTDFAGNPVETKEFQVNWDASTAGKDGYDLYMTKEIHEQPRAIANCLAGRITDSFGLNLPELDGLNLSDIDRIVIVACGTAAYAGMTAAYALEAWTQIPVTVEIASEYRYRNPLLSNRTLVISISQSGETMDTLMAVRYAIEKGAQTLSICNTVGSTIPRESTAALYTHAGFEISVASTKAFVTQITALYLVGLHIAGQRGTLTAERVANKLAALESLPELVEETLEVLDPVAEVSAKYADAKSVLYLGRHATFPVAMEGALKLKELAYMHAEGFAAGELKHGPIALVEPGVPILVVVPSASLEADLHGKIISNIQEVRARGAHVIAIADSGDTAVDPYVVHTVRIPIAPAFLRPILSVVPLQMFARDMAVGRGYDVDQPRNLAKSVTVE